MASNKEHLFRDCAQALQVYTSGWPAMPQFQPPPPPQPIPPPLPPPVTSQEDIQAQQEEEAALTADDPLADFFTYTQGRSLIIYYFIL